VNNCRQDQIDLLRRILKANQDGDFGRKHNFRAIQTYEDFTRAVPLTTYAYVEPYIERCRQGETAALFGPGVKIRMYAMTSGTTGRNKYIPVTTDFLKAYQNGWNIWGIRVMRDHPDAYLRKILQVASPFDQERTPGGTPCGAISGMLARHQKWIVRRYYAVPPRVASIEDAAARYYVIMRIAVPQDVAFVSTANPATTLKLAQTAAANAEKIIRDVHDGTLSTDFEIAADIRKQLKPWLRRDPHRADQLQDILNHKGKLLPRDYWDLAFLANWTGGTLGLYIPRLTELYGTVPVRDIGLLASEGRISVPVDDNTPAGILDVQANFYEFVPVEEIDALDAPDSQPTLAGDFTVLQGCQLEKGQQYYIFLTNHAGLYRYHLGDRINVCDHDGPTPIIEFLSKGAHVSSLTGEKLTEHQVVEVVRSSALETAVSIETFMMIPQWNDPPHYRLYIGSNDALPRPALQQLARMIDQRLAVNNMEYDSKRESGRLGAIEIRQVPVEFIEQHDRKLQQARRSQPEQFKHRFLYNEPVEL
jgi:hypothetical protein